MMTIKCDKNLRKIGLNQRLSFRNIGNLFQKAKVFFYLCLRYQVLMCENFLNGFSVYIYILKIKLNFSDFSTSIATAITIVLTALMNPRAVSGLGAPGRHAGRAGWLAPTGDACSATGPVTDMMTVETDPTRSLHCAVSALPIYI